MSLTSALNAANSALRVNQSALAVVANNVANANTEGYSRQKVVSQTQVVGNTGQGVDAHVIRYADETLQANLDQQTARLAYSETVSEYLSVIENNFGQLDSSSNLEKQFADTFTQLNNLIEDPKSSSNKLIFTNSASQTTNRLNTLANDLAQTQFDIDAQITTDLDTINAVLENINDLNNRISGLVLQNGDSSGLQDLRQQEINKLSEYLSLNVETKENGKVNITLDSGKVLIDSTYVQFSREDGTPFGDIGITRVLNDGELSNTTQIVTSEDLTAGSIGAMVNVRDNDIPNLLAQLDNFAQMYITEFNNIHAQGSAVPPPSVLTSVSHDNGALTTIEELGLQANTDFDISVVDSSGNPIATTADLDYTGSINNSTVLGITSGTYDPQAYMAVNGENSVIEGVASLEYLGSNVYRMTDPSGGVYTATMDPTGFPTATPAALNFNNGVSLVVDTATVEPAIGNIGTVDLQIDGGPIRIEAGDTLQDLADKVNANTALNSELTASVVNGQFILTATNSANGVVLGNDPTGDTFNKIGFNRFFVGTGASDIAVSDSITSDLNNLATSRMREDGGLTHNGNTNIIELTNLQNKQFSFTEAGGLNSQENSITGYLISITSTFAANVNSNEQQKDFNQIVKDDYAQRVASVSGVNTDEEFSDMIVYQRGFEASSRIISVIDEMLDALISMV